MCAFQLCGQTLDHGINATNLGKGDWLRSLPICETALGVTTPPEIFNYEVSKGIQWIGVLGADGSNAWTQFNPGLISQAHAAGLKIFAWGRIYGSSAGNSVQGEINAALTLLGEGADGFLIDPQPDYETNATRTNDAGIYCAAIKAAYPNTFMAYVSFPYILSHGNYPYAVFGYYCDAAMPKAFWGDFLISPAQMLANIDVQWKSWGNSLTGTNLNAIKPIIPMAQGYDGDLPAYIEPASDITNFVYSLQTDPGPAGKGGYNGVSFWECQEHTAAAWAGIAASSIGTSAPVANNSPGITCQPNGNGQMLITLTGQSGKNFILYSSSDLTNWSVATNLANPAGTAQFNDNAATGTEKFYRVSQAY